MSQAEIDVLLYLQSMDALDYMETARKAFVERDEMFKRMQLADMREIMEEE